MIEIDSDEPVFKKFFPILRKDDIAGLRKLAKQDCRILTQCHLMIHEAATQASQKFLKTMIDLGADVEQRDGSGWSALTCAVTNGNLKNTRLLLEAGAKTEQVIYGCANHKVTEPIPLVELLLEYGADINEPLTNLPDLNLMTAALESENQEFIDFLRSKGGLTPDEMKKKKRTQKSTAKAKAKKPTPHEAYHDEIVAHVSKSIGPVSKDFVQQIVPGSNVPIEVGYVPKCRGGSHAMFFTIGIGTRSLGKPKDEHFHNRLELFIGVPKTWLKLLAASKSSKDGWPINVLFNLANFLHNSRSCLHEFTVISNEHPPVAIARGVPFVAFLTISRDKPKGGFKLKSGERITPFDVIPLYREEFDLHQRKGVFEFAKAIDKIKLKKIVDLGRPNAAKKK